MAHPQPAFDFLTSLPVDAPIDESVFIDWFAIEAIDAEKGDNIEDHPEVWNYLELPTALAELSADDYVSVQSLSDKVNLNAFAIGLGLDQVSYQPEVFGGLVYEPTKYDATILVFYGGILISVGEEDSESLGALKHTKSKIESLGLDVDGLFENDIQTGQVSDFI